MLKEDTVLLEVIAVLSRIYVSAYINLLTHKERSRLKFRSNV
jgi:hypothetical protein